MIHSRNAPPAAHCSKSLSCRLAIAEGLSALDVVAVGPGVDVLVVSPPTPPGASPLGDVTDELPPLVPPEVAGVVPVVGASWIGTTSAVGEMDRETTDTQIGCPTPFAESSVTDNPKPFCSVVVWTSTCIRRAPEASLHLVMTLNGRRVPPAAPEIATYESSVTVNSKECRATSYKYGVKPYIESGTQEFPVVGRSC